MMPIMQYYTYSPTTTKRLSRRIFGNGNDLKYPIPAS